MFLACFYSGAQSTSIYVMSAVTKNKAKLENQEIKKFEGEHHEILTDLFKV